MNTPNKTTLTFKGPYEWVQQGSTSVFSCPEKNDSGVYLFTVPVDGKHLVYYVGEMGRSFARRFEEHTRGYLGGQYRIYDPVLFKKGVKKEKLIWEGMILKGFRERMDVFLGQYHSLSPRIYEFLKVLRVLLAPLDLATVDKRVRE